MVRKRLSSLLTAAIVSLSSAFAAIGMEQTAPFTADAAASYPVQQFRMGMSDTDNNVTANGTSLSPSVMKGTNAEKWSINYVSSGVYEIVSAIDGKILTANGSGVSLAADTNAANQRWKIEGVQKDYDGYYLYYKITSNADSSKSLTYTDGAGFGLSKYSGAAYQKYKLNLDGCQGVAANCKTSSGEKACTIGGLLGETVYADTYDKVINYCNSKSPLTIVISGTIDMSKSTNQRIRDNKTLVGAFSNQIIDCNFRTNDAYGAVDDSPSDNIVFRNINFLAKNVKNKILVNIWSSRQIWVDHCTFNSQLSYNRKGDGQDEVGKFIWINTPYADYKDAKDRMRSPDYVTLSYNIFKNRYWTVAYGTQNSEITRDRTSVMYNWWDNDIRRCPQIGNGIMHVVNNYYSSTDSASCSATQQIIGGDGSNILSEKCRFEGFETMSKMIQTGANEKYTDNDSYNGTAKLNYSNKTKSTLNPGKNNYGYYLLDAYNTKNTDTKAFCKTYAGYKASAVGLKYITDSDLASWATTKYSDPFLRHVDLGAAVPASFNNGATYRIKNSNSGLYMQVKDAKADNGTNVQQWGTGEGTIHDIWKLIDAGDGYYYIISAVGDGGTYALDVAGRRTANGTNIDIYQSNGGDNQKFMFTKNADGSYKIRTKVTNGKSAVEIKDAGKGSGDNVQQYEINGASCQDWFLESAENPGCSMNTNVMYEFKNVNSGMVMDIVSGKMEDNTNVQQWSTGHYNSQRWTLQAFAGGGNYYYIRSVSDPSYVLKANGSGNGANVSITKYSTKDPMMLFKFSKNPDGSYHILTRASKDACLVEIPNASTASGANVAQWGPTSNNCQKWTAETYAITTAATTAKTTAKTTAATTTDPMSSTTNAETTTSDVTGTDTVADLDGDNDIDSDDLIIMRDYLVNKVTSISKNADLNGDKKINIFDYILLKRMILKNK